MGRRKHAKYIFYMMRVRCSVLACSLLRGDEGGDAVRSYGANKAALVCVPERRGLVRHRYIFKIGITCSVLLCFFNEPQGCSHE